jgi:hypothetical protein
VVIGPFSEWICYSAYRSPATTGGKTIRGNVSPKFRVWSGCDSKIIAEGIRDFTDHGKDVSLHEMLKLCNAM